MRHTQKTFTLNIAIPETLTEAETMIVSLTTELACKGDTLRYLSADHRQMLETLTASQDIASKLHNANIAQKERIAALEESLKWFAAADIYRDLDSTFAAKKTLDAAGIVLPPKLETA